MEVACAVGDLVGRLKRNTLFAGSGSGVIIVLADVPGGVVGGGRRASLTKHACEEQIDVNIITGHYDNDNDFTILHDYLKLMTKYPR